MKGLLRRLARQFGFEITRIRSGNNPDPFIVMQQLVSEPNPIIFDVGAHVGQTASRYRSLFPSAVIHCFEPFPESFDQLASSLALDALTTPHGIALSDSSGLARLKVNRFSQTNSLLSSDPRASKYWGPNLLDTVSEIEVVTQTIDRFCDEQGVRHISILKLDVQGAEYAVLAGAIEMLKHHSIDIIYMEMIMAPTYVGQRRLQEYLAFFDSNDYVLFDFFNPVHRAGLLIQTDNIMVSARFLKHRQDGHLSSAT